MKLHIHALETKLHTSAFLNNSSRPLRSPQFPEENHAQMPRFPTKLSNIVSRFKNPPDISMKINRTDQSRLNNQYLLQKECA